MQGSERCRWHITSAYGLIISFINCINDFTMSDDKKSLRDRKWVIVIEIIVGLTAISGYGIKDGVDLFEECREEKIKKMKNQAVVLFKNSENDTILLEKPISLFHKLYAKKPEDNTGYKLLIERAEALIYSKDSCKPHYDRVAEKFLEEALNLSEEPAEARNLLIGIRKLK